MKTMSSHQKTSQRKVRQDEQRAPSGAGPDGASVAAPGRTGLPDVLKTGVESLSGMALDDVRVHYNSSKPAGLQALAYTQGTDIHVAPGEERHLPHEAWHVVQQKQGRVKPIMQMKAGVAVNDDAGLEHEADVMGTKWLASHIQPQRALHESGCGCGACSGKPLNTQVLTLGFNGKGNHNAAGAGSVTQLCPEGHPHHADMEVCPDAPNPAPAPTPTTTTTTTASPAAREEKSSEEKKSTFDMSAEDRERAKRMIERMTSSRPPRVKSSSSAASKGRSKNKINLSKEYPYGKADSTPHIHKYARGAHLKISDRGTIKRYNIAKDGKVHAQRTEALRAAEGNSELLKAINAIITQYS